MGKFGSERLILQEPFGPPTVVVDLGMAIDKDGNKITTAGAEVTAVALDDFTQADIDSNTANPGAAKKLTGVTLGTCRALLGGTVAKGDKLAVDTAGKFQVATAGQSPALTAREAGASGDLIEAFKNPISRRTALTNNTGGSATQTALAAGVGVYNLNFQLDLADIADGDLVSDLLLGHKFKILESYFVATEPATTGAKATTLSLAITDVAVTNSAIALTSANCTPAGAKVQNAGALAANTGASTDTLSILAASTTAFVEGKGVLVVCIQNMDTADAIASLNAQA